ncbi:MAG: hypothetical protein R3E18_10790 [Sphingomonadaceae bacterium]|nr:hypothetical protein [Sphingomonadaceae bacterium]
MQDTTQTSEWIMLLMAVYALGASAGELLRPGSWAAMLDDFAKARATSFLTGMVLIAMGGAIYLVTPPWGSGDWVDILIKVTGGGMVVEGFAVLAVAETFMTFSRRIIGNGGRGWAAISLVMGAVLAAVAIYRIA